MVAARKLLLLVAAAIGLCAVTSGASAGSFVVAPLTTDSGPSPVAGCKAGTAPGSVLYPNAEEEPWVDVNPTNPLNLIAVWQQDRWSDGGAKGLVTDVSHNGGGAGRGRSPPFTTRPWGAFGGDGRVYQGSPCFKANKNTNGVLASRSMDGGDTWSEPWTIIRDS